MKQQLSRTLSRLKNPAVVLSIASNLIALFLLLGYKVDEGLIMSAVTIICAILVTLGIFSNPDDNSDNRLYCPVEEERTYHVVVAGRKVCSLCGHPLDQPVHKLPK